MMQRKTTAKTRPYTSKRTTVVPKIKAVDKKVSKPLKVVPKKGHPEPKKYQYYRGNSSSSSFAINTKKVVNSKNHRLRYKISRTQITVVLLLCFIVIGSVMVSKLWREWDKPKATETVQEDNISKPKESIVPTQKTSTTDNQQLFERNQNIIDNSDFNGNTVIRLNVPVYTQTYGQSCEASSLRMALEYRGIKTTDMELLNRMGYDGKAAETIKGRRVWGNPHKQFVGEKDGSQIAYTGYGVFAEPIAAAAKALGRSAGVRDNVTTDWIAAQIYTGNPVVLWGVSVKIADGNWSTSNGETITAPMRTHTRLVVGFKGDPKSPDGFYLNDPSLGKMKYWSTKDLKADIQKGTKQAVAVY